MRHCEEERFLSDVAQHKMVVVRDDGVNRHLRFKKSGTYDMHFDLITWPGYLCYTGDMGTYVFRRLDDMFEFFRTDRKYMERKGLQLAINPGYWCEKLQSISRYGKGYEEFDADCFREVVKQDFEEWVESEQPSDDARAEVWADIEDEVLSCADDGEVRATDAAINYQNREHQFQFRDFWEHRLTRYAYHFIWCCYAIAWGIKTYDEASEKTEGRT